jgi:imidazole glycerol-phosphate synthase subunit HisH
LVQTIAIIDYGSGNLHSAAKAFERAASETGILSNVVVTSDPDRVAAADRIVLPGVGAFADCARGLDALTGMRDALDHAVHRRGQPFLGICVGMQLLATRGLEFGETRGLGWIAGDVLAIEPRDRNLKVPHMGWNTIDVTNARSHALLAGIKTGPTGLHAYFVHSYHLAAVKLTDIAAVADYGGPVTAMVACGNIVGTQFHPEKSQALGLRLIGNFLSWRP